MMHLRLTRVAARELKAGLRAPTLALLRDSRRAVCIECTPQAHAARMVLGG
jgi:hypothetical protein